MQLTLDTMASSIPNKNEWVAVLNLNESPVWIKMNEIVPQAQYPSRTASYKEWGIGLTPNKNFNPLLHIQEGGSYLTETVHWQKNTLLYSFTANSNSWSQQGSSLCSKCYRPTKESNFFTPTYRQAAILKWQQIFKLLKLHSLSVTNEMLL